MRQTSATTIGASDFAVRHRTSGRCLRLLLWGRVVGPEGSITRAPRCQVSLTATTGRGHGRFVESSGKARGLRVVRLCRRRKGRPRAETPWSAGAGSLAILDGCPKHGRLCRFVLTGDGRGASVGAMWVCCVLCRVNPRCATPTQCSRILVISGPARHRRVTTNGRVRVAVTQRDRHRAFELAWRRLAVDTCPGVAAGLLGFGQGS